jgi:hypothetical protein
LNLSDVDKCELFTHAITSKEAGQFVFHAPKLIDQPSAGIRPFREFVVHHWHLLAKKRKTDTNQFE